MKIVVTGGAGYIGSVTVAELQAAGHEPVVFDSLFQGHREAVPPGVPFVHGDLADRNAIAACLAEHQPQAIMHFASRTLVGESVQQPFAYLGENVTNGLNLLQAAVEHGVERFILSSTANLFDDPEKMPIDEQERIVPGSPYGESKAILERMLYWLDRTKGLKFAALRYFNAAGCTPERGEDHDPETHLIPLVLQVALGQREKITIFGDDYDTPDGTCIRDYIHVVDLAQAHIMALEAIATRSRVYNLGNGRGFSVQQVIETAREVTGQAIPAQVGPRRAGDPATLVASSQKIREELRWQPKFPELRQIVESAWQWHKANPSGYRRQAATRP